MITSILATAIATSSPVAQQNSGDTLAHALPDPLLGLVPYFESLNYPVESQSIRKAGHGNESPSIITDDTVQRYIVARSDIPFAIETELQRKDIVYSVALSPTYMTRAARDIARSEENTKKEMESFGAPRSKGLGKWFQIDVGDVGAVPVLHTQQSQITFENSRSKQSFIVSIDLNGQYAYIHGANSWLGGNPTKNLAWITTLTRRMTAFIIGEKKIEESVTTFGDLKVPTKKFFIYKNKMVSLNHVMNELNVTWNYIPETAEIQIAGRNRVRLHLGTRTYHIDNQKWVADAPVTIHNQEFYIEENAMATILNAL